MVVSALARRHLPARPGPPAGTGLHRPRMPSVEVNGTFYSLTRPSTCAAWRAAVPEGFTFAIKGSRFITHMLKLKKFEGPLANFFSSGLLRLWRQLPQDG